MTTSMSVHFLRLLKACPFFQFLDNLKDDIFDNIGQFFYRFYGKFLGCFTLGLIETGKSQLISKCTFGVFKNLKKKKKNLKDFCPSL